MVGTIAKFGSAVPIFQTIGTVVEIEVGSFSVLDFVSPEEMSAPLPVVSIGISVGGLAAGSSSLTSQHVSRAFIRAWSTKW